MIRLFFLLLFFILYGVQSIFLNDLILFSLVNISFFSILRQKNLYLSDYLIFICSIFLFEIFTNLPLFLGVVILSLPTLGINRLIYNFNFNNFYKSFVIFILSLLTIFGIDKNIYPRALSFDYFIFFMLFIFVFLGLQLYGKKQN